MLGVFVLAILFIGTFAYTHAPRTTAAKGKITTNVENSVTSSLLNASTAPLPACVASALSWENVFEIDGNAAADDTCGTTDDWNLFLPGTVDNTATTVTLGTGPPGSALNWSFIADPPIKTDLIYSGGGSKDFKDVTSWRQVARGTGPPKDDVEHAFAAKYHDGITGHDVIVFGGDRPTNNGDANIGFWFFQNEVAPVTSGALAGTFSGEHKNGDVFVLSAFGNGGGNVGQVEVLVWVGDDPATAATVCGASPYFGTIDPKSDSPDFPNGSLCVLPGAGGTAGVGITNGAPILVSWQYVNKDTRTDCKFANLPCTIPSPDFFEGAIDLNNLGLATECFASFLLETRSSDEVSAVLKDFAIGDFQLNCTLDCSKVASADVCEGGDITFTYTVTNGGVDITAKLRDDLGNDGTTTPDIWITGTKADDGTGTCVTSSTESTIALTANQIFTCTRKLTSPAAGTYTDKLYATGTNGSGSIALDCNSGDPTVVHVFPNPDITISTITCGDGVTMLTATDSNNSGATFSWTTPSGTDSGATINVTGIGSYTVTATAGTCTDTATRVVSYCSDGL
jgi:hypothetical protein